MAKTKKLNMTIGRFQPFTIGHNNMVNEGGAPCIVYQIKPAGLPENIKNWKVIYDKGNGKTGSHTANKKDVKNVIYYMENNGVWPEDISEQEKEIAKAMMKRPFTNELVEKELKLVKKTNKNIKDIVYVSNMFEAIGQFNKFCIDNKDKWEPQYLMCGDDRVKNYSELIDKYDELPLERDGEEVFPNVLKGVMKTNVGKGRTPGISGTAVRKSIIENNITDFKKQMPEGTESMLPEFKQAFDEFKEMLKGYIKECGRTSLTDYIKENLLNKE